MNQYNGHFEHLLSMSGKVHPGIGHADPEKKLRYSSTLSLTSALYGGGW